MCPGYYTIFNHDKKRTFYKLTDKKTIDDHKKLIKFLGRHYCGASDRTSSIIQLINALSDSIYNKVPNTSKEYPNHYLLSSNHSIIKGDIENFFPSINKHNLYSRIICSTEIVLSFDQHKILSDILLDKNFNGLPQGFAISSILSEIYLNNFDDQITTLFPDCVYIRYVDDFIIVAPQHRKTELESFIKKSLSQIELSLSSDKFNSCDFINEKTFSFLGYTFQNIDNKYLNVFIQDKKIKKINRKIDKYFLNYSSDGNFSRLYYKIFNLFNGITTISPKNNKIQYYGIPFVYSHAVTFPFKNIAHSIEFHLRDINSKSPKFQSNTSRKHHIDQKKRNQIRSIYQDLLDNNKVDNKKFNYLKTSRRKLIIMISKINGKSPSCYKKTSKKSLIKIFFKELYK